jgi:hypothetical protein
MARVARIDRGKTAREIEVKAMRVLWNRFQSLVKDKLKDLIEKQTLPQWDDPANETQMTAILKNIAAKPLWTGDDLVKIGGLAALLDNFTDEEE